MARARRVAIIVSVCLITCAAVTAQTPVTPEGWVVLPVDEYHTLRQRANPRPTSPAAPPVDATLTRIDYDLRVDTDTVSGRAVLTIDVLRDGWSRLQIPAGLMVREATLDGQPVALVDGPPPHVLLSHAGRSILTLDIALPLSAAAGAAARGAPTPPGAACPGVSPPERACGR